MDAVKIGLCGLGTVAGGTLRVLSRNFENISARAGCDIQIVRIGARRDNPDCDTGDIPISRDLMEVATDPEVEILVELIGGTDYAAELVLAGIANGKHIVTANKALIAERGNEIFAAAEAAGVTVAYEAAVAGGIPIIKAVREGLAANSVNWLAGIINGTGNFILTEMKEKGRSFADVLAEAQALGYAEADPTFDVEGIDAAHKLVILASIAFGMPLSFDEVYTEGIGAIETQDVDYAEELGYRIKHLGIARKSPGGIELRVHPTLIPQERLLANVNGVKNAVVVDCDAVGQTLYYGAGAGSEPTASAVLADVIDIARNVRGDQSRRVPYLSYHSHAIADQVILPIEAIQSSYYLRVSVLDRPGVLSAVASILSDAGISIEAIIQKAPRPDEDVVPVIILTNSALEQSLADAVFRLQSLDSVVGAITRIRVENLDD